MRARSSLERLANAGSPLLANADALVDVGEREQILERIVASERSAVRRRRPLVIALGAAVVIGAAVAAVAMHRDAAPRAKTASGHRHIALTGARIQMAGYHFRTPAGFTASDVPCDRASSPGGPATVLNGFSSVAAADGGCVEAFVEIPGSVGAPDPIPADADPVQVGAYQGFFVAQGSSGEVLYVRFSKSADEGPVYLVLFAQDLTEDQLVAVAQSGLPGSP